MKADPYNDNKVAHRAKHIAPDGSVSPLCAPKPKAIDMNIETWTTSDDAVTCTKCLTAMKLPK